MRVLLAFLCVLPAQSPESEPPDIETLRQQSYSAELRRELDLAETGDYRAYLVSYRVAGLKVYAMVAIPKQPAPDAGYPVLVANHGYHPDPPQYGITAEGVDSRPGDYYRSVPGLYASRGFLVIMPDYRGHNISEGLEFTRSSGAAAYYAEDVLTLLSALPGIPEADIASVFMWGHSLGGAVSLRVLLATDAVKAATIWSTAPVADLAPWIADLSTPLLLHHAEDDASTARKNSAWLTSAIESSGRSAVYYRYSGDSHFFEGEALTLAADRDAEFFRKLTGSD